MVDTVKSLSITALDAVGTTGPITANTSPNGAQFYSKLIRDYVTPTQGGLGSTSSTYKTVRVPTNCYLKKVSVVADSAIDTNGAPTLAVDVGIYYSDSTTDGTPAANQGTVVSGQTSTLIAAALFGAATTLSISSDGKWTAVKRQQPLWQAAGLSVDPGGNFDIVVAVHTASATAPATPGNVDVQADIGFP